MVGKYNVVSKGKYIHKQTSDVLRIERFLIVRKRSRRMLLLEVNNCASEALSALKLQIDQFDAKGNSLGSIEKEWKKLSIPSGQTLLKKPIGVQPSCVDIRVKILYAECGNFLYRLGKEGAYVTFEKKNERRKLSEATIRAKTGEQGISTTPRKFKAPVFLAVCTTILMAISAVIAAVQIQNFKNNSSFFLNNLTYEFVDGYYYEGAPVYITGYVGLGGEELLIPNEIEGHPVLGIANYAFSYNMTVKKVTVEEGVEVSEYAFQQCYNLERVELKGNNVIKPYAFTDCGSLESVIAFDLKQIGENAFADAYDLKTLRITSAINDTDALKIDANAFTNCTHLSEVYIDDYVSYSSTTSLFNGTSAVDSLYLKNYNYSEYESNTQKKMSRLFGNSSTKIGTLEIGYADAIPDEFVYGNTTLRSVKIKNLTGSEIGDRAFADCTALTEISLPKQMTDLGEYALRNTAITAFEVSAVENMGNGVFSGCKSLSAVNFGTSTLKTIPEDTFEECVSLSEIKLPNGLKSIEESAFYSCTALREVELPDGIESIGEIAFGDATELRYISLPKSLQHIDSSAFAQCYRLHEIENLSDISIVAGKAYSLGEYTLKVYTSATEDRIEKYETGNMVFGNVDGTWYALEYTGNRQSYVMPEYVLGNPYVLTSYLFYNENVSEITVKGASGLGESVFNNSGVRKLYFTGSGTLDWTAASFSGVNDLETIDFGSRSFSSVYAETFASLYNLKEVKLPSTVTEIEDSAFSSCSNLKSVTGTSAVTEIGDSAFENCFVLQYSFSNSLQTIGDYAFYNCYKIETLYIPSNTVTIGDYAFASCRSLRSVTGGNNLTTIGDGAFQDCSALQSFYFSSRITSIGSYAFSNCSSLMEADLPSNLETIQSGTFNACSSMEKVYLPSGLKNIYSDAFYGCNKLHEVYNLAGLALTANSESNGYVAYNALAIYSSRSSASLSKTTYNGVVYKYSYSSGVCAVVGYTGSASSLTLDSSKFSSYIIARYAFVDCSDLRELRIGSAVTDIRDYAFTGMSNLRRIRFDDGRSLTVKDYAFNGCSSLKELIVSTSLQGIQKYAFSGSYNNLKVYYEGSKSYWNNYGSDRYSFYYSPYLYYYDNCAHDSDEWKYDRNGEIDTSNKEFTIKKVVVAATCTTNGTMQYSCPDCTQTMTSTIYATGHKFNGGKCTVCGYVYENSSKALSRTGTIKSIVGQNSVFCTTNYSQPNKAKETFYQE